MVCMLSIHEEIFLGLFVFLFQPCNERLFEFVKENLLIIAGVSIGIAVILVSFNFLSNQWSLKFHEISLSLVCRCTHFLICNGITTLSQFVCYCNFGLQSLQRELVQKKHLRENSIVETLRC